ncbi:hypothetical protein IGI37_000722 [Enterococcus sp. AZ194]|uniref:DUF58 domain-containing protein n=1 Tax=Enterococcus sp. AZ194 TaxID=2774629 RepID=UPI003F21356A
MRKKTMIGRLILVSLAYIILFFYAITFTNDTGWAVLVFASLVAGVELLSLISPLRLLQLKLCVPRVASVGERLTSQITVKRKGPIPLFFSHLILQVPTEKKRQTIDSYYGQKTQVELSMIPTARGWQKQLSVEQVSGDLFGWFEKKKVSQLAVDCLVLPAIHPSAESVLTNISGLVYKEHSGEQTYLLRNYRAYQQGDSLKQIDWKLSSRKQELIFREYEKLEPVKWTFVFYGVESQYFEETLSLFYTIFMAYRQHVEFLLIGEELNASNHASPENFADIQPLEKLVTIPEKKNRRICLFVPEVTDDLAEMIDSKSMSVVVYRQLIKEWEGVRETQKSK